MKIHRRQHISDLERIAEEQGKTCGELVSYYERRALKNSRPSLKPSLFDYCKAYEQTLKKYGVKE